MVNRAKAVHLDKSKELGIKIKRSPTIIKFTKSDEASGYEKAKTSLGFIIKNTIIRNNWNQTTAASIMDTDQPKISQICNDKVDKFSLKRLYYYIMQLNLSLSFKINERKNRKYQEFDFIDITDKEKINDIKIFLADIIHKIIKDQNWTQDEAAEEWGVDQPKISQICSGHLSGYSIERLKSYIVKKGYKIEVIVHKTDT